MKQEELIKMRKERRYCSERSIAIKLKKIGTIKEIINSKEKLLELLSHKEFRVITMFIYKFNSALKKEEIKEEELELLRSDWLITQIINLDKIVREQQGRELEECEIRDKLNQFTLIKDEKIALNIFANPILIKEILKTPYNYNLTDWMKSGYIHNLPIVIEMKIISAFKLNGDLINGDRMMYNLMIHEQHKRDLSEGGEIYNLIHELANQELRNNINKMDDSKPKVKTLYEKD